MKLLAPSLVLVLLAGCSLSPTIEATGLEEWERVVAAHQGGVTAVLVWATWCRPCLDLLPEFVALQRSEGHGDVAFVTVTLDEHDAPGAMTEAVGLVQELDARFPHYAFRADVEQAMHRLGIEDVPAVLVLDQGGEVRYRLTGDSFDNEIGAGDVEDAIESLR